MFFCLYVLLLYVLYIVFVYINHYFRCNREAGGLVEASLHICLEEVHASWIQLNELFKFGLIIVHLFEIDATLEGLKNASYEGYEMMQNRHTSVDRSVDGPRDPSTDLSTDIQTFGHSDIYLDILDFRTCGHVF